MHDQQVLGSDSFVAGSSNVPDPWNHGSKSVILRLMVLFALVAIPVTYIAVYLLAAPLSGSYYTFCGTNKSIVAWYFLVIYYFNTWLLPSVTVMITLRPLPLPANILLCSSFLLFVGLIFQFTDFANNPAFRFFSASIGILQFFSATVLAELCCRSQRISLLGTRVLVAAVNIAMTFSIYYFCVLMLQLLQNTTDRFIQVAVGFSFQLGAMLNRGIISAVSKLHPSFTDRTMINVESINMMVSYMISQIFYRVLFQELSSVDVFAGLQVASLAVELFVYVVLLLKPVRNTQQRLKQFFLRQFSCCAGACNDAPYRAPSAAAVAIAEPLLPHSHELSEMNSAATKRDSSEVTAKQRRELEKCLNVFRRTATSFLLRHICNLVSICVFLTLAGVLNVSYVHPHFQPLYSEGTTLVYVAVSALVDIIGLVMVTVLWRVLFGRTLWGHWWGFLRRPHYRHVVLMMICAAHVSSDLTVALYRPALPCT
eukprot:TRINITY_DN352_c1_g2_i1.p1 TRINITY_DN352_c1_g2~~TRINITY_DN352_c1_g2_i1.p1  ORF type:complete len:483 (+),score=80.24 TRINITY_DN352_c1_g2_i1:70-1518(+)